MSTFFSGLGVVKVLSDPAISKVGFSINGVSVTPGMFSRVSNAVLTGKIKVTIDSNLSEFGSYDHVANNLIFQQGTFPNALYQSLVVHEACHAGLDIAGAALLTEVCEAAAYISQCLFARSKSAANRISAKRDDTASEAIFSKAWEIACQIHDGKTPSPSDLQGLILAIRNHPTYAAWAAQSRAYNGVPGA